MADNNHGEKVFTQEEVNRIVSERLAQERKKYDGIDDFEAVRAELNKYRTEAAQVAQEKRMAAVMDGREFTNEYTKTGIMAEFRAAVEDPANQEKGDAELFSALTKDKPGIFKSMYPHVNMGGFKSVDSSTDMIAEAFKPKI